jgi:hypothetical protein|tara:strand:- start:9364 stop:10215 length:852 start_codon:yes stop_codon:yes gene_type:complete
MKFKLWKQHGALNSKPIFAAFERSIVSCGHSVTDSDTDSDVNVIWSVLFNGRMAPNKAVWEQKKPTIVLEVGGIKRGTTWKVGINGINRDGYFGPGNNDNSRSRNLGLFLKPWRKEGKYILLCGQHDKSLQWKDMPRMSQWVIDIVTEIRKYSDRMIKFRPHPRCRLDSIEAYLPNVLRQEPVQLIGTYDDFDMSFEDVWATISWSSNPGIHSVINGVPAYTGPSSLAYDVSMQDLSTIEDPILPDREQWLNDYAWTEFTVEEIEQGLPLKRLENYLKTQINS